ncbi:MAG: TatD family hydrolase [Candidatus Thermoplasmatota archaeon]|nr:TatD family hydrolase [Candidatus Thermoplasmatota archaeon]
MLLRILKKAGGTHFVLCQLPMVDIVVKEKSYESYYLETLEMVKIICSAVDIGVFATVGPYPVDYIKLRQVFGREQAIKIMRDGMDIAADLCLDHRCIAIGEIGRPHFPVDEEVLVDSNEILFYGMQKAKEAGVPVVLHTESTTPDLCRELVEMGRKAGLPAHMIVKHYSPPLIKFEDNYGLMPSVLASEKNVVSSLLDGTRFMMETDYIDDPRRPGVVLSPKTVPKRTFELIKKGLLSENQAYEIHKENPEKTYGISLEG